MVAEVMRLQDWWRYALAAGGAITSYLFGGWNALLEFLFVLAAADYASGMTAAALEGVKGKGPGLSSEVGARGIAKKVFMFVVVALGNFVDRATGDGHMVRDGATWFYIGNELLSILENVGRIGVPIPPVITQAVAVLRGKVQLKQ